MINKEYKNVRDKALDGRIVSELFPYLFEYYQEKCDKPLITNYLDFSNYFSVYMNTPLFLPNGQMIQRIELIHKHLNKVFNYLDKKYTEND